MPEYGLGQGLAFNIDYNSRINQLHRNEELDLRARNAAEAKASLMAQDAEFTNAMNAHDNPLIKEQARATLKKMGEYRRDNADLNYNPDKLIQFNLMKRELNDNPNLIRGLSSDNNYKEYVKDLQEVSKNPLQHDTGAYDEIQNQWSNYLQYGNQNGLEAFQKEGKKAFLYSKPKDFIDLTMGGLKVGDAIKNYNVVKGRNGEWWSEPDKAELDAVTKSFYQQNERQIQVEAQKLGLDTPEKVNTWVSNLIAPGIKRNYNAGEVNADWEHWYKMQQLNLEKEKLNNTKKPENNYSTWKYFTDPKNLAGTLSEETIRKTWGDKPNMILVGNSGAKADLTGYEWYPTQRYVKRQGIPFLLGYTKIPLSVAAEKGIINKYDEKDETDEYKDTNARITSDYLGHAAYATEMGKDGKRYNYIKVSYNLPVNPNDQVAQQKFNVFNDVDKLVPASQDPYGGNGKKAAPPGSAVDQAGNVFSGDGKFLGKISEFE